jgi:multiple sugar transport system permease protein
MNTPQRSSAPPLRSPAEQRRGDPEKRMSAVNRDAVERRVFGVLRPAIILFLLIITLFPFYYMVLLSFRPLDAVLQEPGALLPKPGEIELGTYRDVLASTEDGGQGFLNFIKNSFFVAIGTVVLSLLVAIPGAYAVSRLDFFGRRQISAVFLGVYFFPSILLAIPLFVFFTRIQQRGTLTGLLVVYVAQVAAVSIYMLRNYFDTIPASLEESAAIDGCTRLQAMRHISLPLAMPAIASNALFVFMIAWNEFLFALLFLVEKRDNWTVSLGLSQLAGSIEVPTTVLMAGSVILTVPIIVLFFLSERWLAGGLTAGAEKG